MTKEGRNTRILIVDDDAGIRNILGVILTKRGFIIEEAENGKVALAKIAKNKPDLILLDVKMPVMDGFQTYKHLKSASQTKGIPVIFCTSGHIEDIQKVKIGTDECIRKPIKLKELDEKINKILESKE
ncbi:MAG: response regulator [Candidatus Omnitrophota bacterium]|nr:MAG: response regulator [Candidatus Omnitrophota bacterium]